MADLTREKRSELGGVMAERVDLYELETMVERRERSAGLPMTAPNSIRAALKALDALGGAYGDEPCERVYVATAAIDVIRAAQTAAEAEQYREKRAAVDRIEAALRGPRQPTCNCRSAPMGSTFCDSCKHDLGCPVHNAAPCRRTR